jgi:hypothetical protein
LSHTPSPFCFIFQMRSHILAQAVWIMILLLTHPMLLGLQTCSVVTLSLFAKVGGEGGLTNFCLSWQWTAYGLLLF